MYFDPVNSRSALPVVKVYSAEKEDTLIRDPQLTKWCSPFYFLNLARIVQFTLPPNREPARWLYIGTVKQ